MTSFLVVLIGVQVLCTTHNRRFSVLMSLSLFCFAAVALGPFYNDVSNNSGVRMLQILIYGVANSLPMMLALLAFFVFDDKDISNWKIYSFGFAFVFIDMYDLWMSRHESWPTSSGLIIIFEYLPQVVKIFFFLLAGYAVLKSWNTDLLQSRFMLRRIVFVIACLIGLEILLLENLIGIAYKIPFDTVQFHIIWQFFISLVLFFALLVPKTLLANVLTKSKPLARSWTNLSEKAKQLQELIDSDIIRDNDLNIAKLALAIGIPEYQLRKLINQEMGYRNFNDFLNDHRIDRVCKDLHDPQKDNLPILTVALEAGYGSLSSFNRAFKERMNMTPKEYRAKRIPAENSRAN